MNTITRLQIAALPILAATGVAAALAAGSGSGASAGTTLRGSNQAALPVLRDLARCIRAHGLPSFPDPQVGRDGVPRFPDSAPHVPQQTQQACSSIASRIPPGYSETQPASTDDLRKLLRLAACIRAHGVRDWPDPNSLGQFPINRRIERGGKRLFIPAVRACARLNPNPSGGLNVVRARP